LGKIKICTVCFVIVLANEVRAEEETEVSSEVYLAPFQGSQGLFLNGSDLSTSAIKVVSKKLDNPDITVGIDNTNHSYLRNSETLTLNFSKDGIPLCTQQVRATVVANTLALFGDIPKVEQNANAEFREPNLPETLVNAWSAIKIDFPIQNEKMLRKRQCYFVMDNSLFPVWDLTLQTERLNYQVWADETRIYKLSKLYFDATAKIQAFTRDSISNKETSLFNEDVSGDNLKNSYFNIDPSTQDSGIERAVSAEHSFIYAPGNPLFDEASVFVHVNEHYKFFQTLGYSWAGKSPITVTIHARTGDTDNNAFYQPADSSSNPLIMIGDGDGKVLRNLSLDADVVSHEFGHHVIFKNVQETSGESLVLHEGIADYFVFAKTGDACLGRSICVPGGSTGVCALPDQCLRTASKTLQYGSEEYLAANSHQRGQLVSGFLYGLNDFIDPKKVPQLVYNALQLLVNNSGLRHLVLATMLSDYKMNKGENACKIYDAALARGLSSQLKDIQCSNQNSITLVNTPAPPKQIVVQRKKKRGFLGCSGLAKIPSEQFDATVFFFLIPIVVRRRFKF